MAVRSMQMDLVLDGMILLRLSTRLASFKRSLPLGKLALLDSGASSPLVSGQIETFTV